MGCDIHVFIESLTGFQDFGWESFGGRIDVGRHATLFGLLAGVRGVEEAIVTPRGLPPDMSETVRTGLAGNLHTHSWLRRKELRDVINTLRGDVSPEQDVSPEWDAILAVIKVLDRAGRKVRIVFAFDS